MTEEVNRKLLARNTTVQLLTLYIDSERQNSQRYRQTILRAVRSAKKWCLYLQSTVYRYTYRYEYQKHQ